jgi:hypothetical protein
MLKVLRSRWRLIVALLFLLFVLALLYLLTHQTEASHALNRVQVGMTRDDVLVAVNGAGCNEGYSYHVNSTRVHGENWTFADKSKLNVSYLDGIVNGVQLCEPAWQLEIRFWLLKNLGLNVF